MKNFEYKGQDLLVITFDDEETTLKVIMNDLKASNFTINGEPVYVK